MVTKSQDGATSGLRSGTLFLVLAALVAVLGALPFLKGAFYLGKHEGDTLHLAELVMRMAGGQWPHLDFMTPIGVMALAPIALFVKQGLGIGHAIFWSQILVAAVLLLPAMRVATSRLTGWWQLFYGAYVMIFCLALVHGEAERAVSISMHYNRWAWAVAYIVIPLAVLAPLRAPRPALDGALIGLGLALLVLTKVTYFVSFAPAVLIALLARRQWATIAAAGVAGLAVAGAVTAMAGVEFWLAYLGDLRTVSASDIRAAPGEPLAVVIAAPPYMGASLALVACVILLRQSGRMVEGMALLFLMPGFFFVTYQNFGNDPQWLLLLAIFAFCLRPEPGTVNARGWDMREALRIVGILALAFGLPSAVNLLYSPFRHLATEEKDRVPLLPGRGDDLLTIESRLYRVDETVAADLPGSAFESYRSKGERKYAAKLLGETLPECTLSSGMNAWFETVAKDLEAAGYGGSHVMGTDLFSLYWAFGDFKTVKGAAPWYYGGLSGAENADYIVVPICPMAEQIRAGMLEELAGPGWKVEMVRRTPLYVLITAKRV
ncbi:MAG: hypothetical protein ACKVPY_07570 [Paracoccaceae bacterium]